MNALEELKRLATEVGEVIQQVETEQGGDTAPPAPLNYSSTVSSVTVDPVTGNISVSLTLYPGDEPITPAPTPEEQAAAAETVTEDVPPGQVPAA